MFQTRRKTQCGKQMVRAVQKRSSVATTPKHLGASEAGTTSYDTGLSLIQGGRAAGTPDRNRGELGNLINHYRRDVLTYETCCEECEDPEFCSYYVGGTVDGESVTGAREDTVSMCP